MPGSSIGGFVIGQSPIGGYFAPYTLLSICQAVASVIPVGVPSAIVGSNDETAQILLGLANEAGNSLARRPDGGWVNTIREYDFTTVAVGPVSGTIANTGSGGQAQITGLTVNAFTTFTPNTWYAAGTGVKNNTLIASVDSASQVTLSQSATATGTGTFNFGQSDYQLPPDFQRIVDNTIWDRSRFWSMRGPMSPQQWQLYKSSVIGKASIQRRYRFRYINGQQMFSVDPVPMDNGSALVFEYVSSAWCQSAEGAPQASWQADTDYPILDGYLIQLGLKWRLLRRLGLSYAEELSEYEYEVSKALAADGGAAILDLTPPDHLALIGPWNVPETNFGGVTG